MSQTIRNSILLLLLATLLVGCGSPAFPGLPVALGQAEGSPQPERYQAPRDATATPTPFQPLAPTALYLPTSTPTATPTYTPQPTATFTPEPTSPPKKKKGRVGQQPEGQINILLLGADARPHQTRFRTDTIILATLNKEYGTANLTSFPRDLWVTLPNWGANRINTAYEFGGFDLLADTFQANFGVRPDHYVIINFESFKRFIDDLGGLDVNVKTPVSDYYNGRYISIPKGEMHMDADLVLWYARSRKTSNDFARTKRQHEILTAIFDKLLTVDTLKQAPQLYETYKDSVITDLSFTDLIPLLPLGAKLVANRENIRHYFVGPKMVSDWITPEGAMVLLPNMAEINVILNEALNIP